MDSMKFMTCLSDSKEQEYRQSFYQKDFNSIKKSINEIMPTAYGNAAWNRKRAKYHNARGTKLMKSGEDVLEIQIAGSGMVVPKRTHKDLSSENSLLYTPTRRELEEDDSFKGKDEVHVTFQEMRMLAQLKLQSNDPKEFEEALDSYIGAPEKGISKRKKELIERNMEFFIKDILEDRQEPSIYSEYYGENYLEDDARLCKKYIYKKNSKYCDEKNNTGKKIKLSFAGPMGVGGAIDAGTYSINHLKEYILISAQNYLTPTMQEWYLSYTQMQLALANGNGNNAEYWRSKLKKSHVLISAHSRGAVAASQGAMMIKYWLDSEFPEYADWVNVEVIQRDPVPGYDSDSDFNNEVDYQNSNKHLSEKYKFYKMKSLGKEAETTVMYSMITDHKYCFAPQKVKGAKRVILMLAKHNAQQNDVDIIDGEKRQATYTDFNSGEKYRGTGISELPPGVYLVDEKKQLIRMKNYEETCRIMERIINGNYRGQEKRLGRIKEVLKDWFDRDDGTQDLETLRTELNKVEYEIADLKDTISQLKEKISVIMDTETVQPGKSSTKLDAHTELLRKFCTSLMDKETRRTELQEEIEKGKKEKIEQTQQDAVNYEERLFSNDLKENVIIMQDRLFRNPNLKSIWKNTAETRNRFWACIDNEDASSKDKKQVSDEYCSLMCQNYDHYLKERNSRRDVQLHLFNYVLALVAFTGTIAGN